MLAPALAGVAGVEAVAAEMQPVPKTVDAMMGMPAPVQTH